MPTPWLDSVDATIRPNHVGERYGMGSDVRAAVNNCVPEIDEMRQGAEFEVAPLAVCREAYPHELIQMVEQKQPMPTLGEGNVVVLKHWRTVG
jgi:hypothetical protein